jgi:hypothetical protein
MTVKAPTLAQAIASAQAAADAVVAKVPGTPRVVVTLVRANSDRRRKRALYGYTTVAKVWRETESGERYLEIGLAAEHLNREPAAVFGTLLHELAHAYNLNNGITDCDTNGRHNKNFQRTAEEKFGLMIEQAPGIGWSVTTCPDDTVKRFAGAFTHTVKATRFQADAPSATGTPRGRDRNLPVATCGCGHKVRAARAVIDAGITCKTCGEDFEFRA